MHCSFSQMFLKADKIVYLLGIISSGRFAALVSIYSTRTEFVGSTQNKTHVHCNEGTRHPVQQHGSLMCFEKLLDNNGGLRYRGISYIKLCYTGNIHYQFIVGFGYSTEFVDNKNNIECQL